MFVSDTLGYDLHLTDVNTETENMKAAVVKVYPLCTRITWSDPVFVDDQGWGTSLLWMRCRTVL